jgi:hypothetical protein
MAKLGLVINMSGANQIQELNIWLLGNATEFRKFSVTVGGTMCSGYDG